MKPAGLASLGGIAMDDQVWKRHANRWSVITRFSAIPLIVLAIWGRVWIGWWSLGLFAIVALWIWVNPRVFPVPLSTDNWASKAVLGERVWLNRRTVPIPRHHERAALVLNLLNGCGGLVLLYGLIVLDPWYTGIGFVVMFFGKTWFLDRMVWLFEDMMHTTAQYRDWLY